MKQTLKTKLRIRFVLLAMLSLLVVQSVIVGVSIYHNHRDLLEKSDMLISQLRNNPSGTSRYFSVRIPAEKDTVFPDAVQHVSVTAEEVTAFARRALAQNREKGFVDGYRYRIYQNESGTKIYFLFRESSIEMYKLASENMIWVSLLGSLVVCTVLVFVSGWVVKPLVDNHNKQKQFITAAGHELKTPLTVISTNAQMLAMEIGQNEWLDGIEKQIGLLTQLTHELVVLSKAEEADQPLVRESFSLCHAVQDEAAVFEALAKQKNIQIRCVVPSDLAYYGNKAQIRQLLRILLDNACKYSTDDGFIHISAKQIIHGVQIAVTNSCKPLDGEERKALLQRFYRGQNAAGKPGFGLGLSIAETIVNRHNGQLSVSATTEGEFFVEVRLR